MPGVAANSLRALRDRELPFRLDQNALAVAIVDRHAHARRADLNRVVADDLPRLVDHLHFFGGVALLFVRADLRNQIEGDRMGKCLGLEMRLPAIAARVDASSSWLPARPMPLVA